jgi:CheY-like chemotaxis protein
MPAKTVLVVDGDEDQHRICGAYLPHLGYGVLAARTGQEGVRIARESRPDLVVLDLLLPGMDGRRVFDTLRADPATAHIPVLLLTAAVNWQRLWDTESRRLRVQLKPCTPLELAQAVREMIGEP